jgi:hypothetical protein
MTTHPEALGLGSSVLGELFLGSAGLLIFHRKKRDGETTRFQDHKSESIAKEGSEMLSTTLYPKV